MQKFLFLVLAATVLAGSAVAQTPAEGAAHPAAAASSQNVLPPNTAIVVVLSKTVDAGKAKVGGQVTAKVAQDVLNQGKVVLPRDTRLIGHVTEVQARSKGQNESQLGIAWDRAILKHGQELPLRAVIQALAPPLQVLSSGMGGMSAENSGGALGQPGAAQGGMAGSMGSPGMGRPGGPPDGAPGIGDQTGMQPPAASGHAGPVLSASNSGVQGMPGVTLMVPAANASAALGSRITSDKNNVKLVDGTQLVLRVVNQ